MKTIGRLVLALCIVVICSGNAHTQSILIHSDIEVFDGNNNNIGVLQQKQNGGNLKVYNTNVGNVGMFINFDAYGKLMTPKVPIFFTQPGCVINFGGFGSWVPLNMDWRPETQFTVYRFLSNQPVSIVPSQFINTQPPLGSCAVSTLVSIDPASAPTFTEECLPASDCPTPDASHTFIMLNIQSITLPFNTPLIQPLHLFSFSLF